MCSSPALAEYISQFAGKEGVSVIGASSLINSLVETGLFVSDTEGTLSQVQALMKKVAADYPAIDVFTLSSTHLPWLNRDDIQPYFNVAAPNKTFIDPAEDVVKNLVLPNNGRGILAAIATGTPELPVEELSTIFRKMKIQLDIKPASFRTQKDAPAFGKG